MSGITLYLAEHLLDHSLHKTSFTQPAACYMGLCTNATAGDTGNGGTFTELTLATNGYARQSITWNAAGSSGSTNSGTVTFGPCSTGNWGAVYGWSIFDASTAGNQLYFGQLSSSATINVGDSLTMAATTGIVINIS